MPIPSTSDLFLTPAQVTVWQRACLANKHNNRSGRCSTGFWIGCLWHASSPISICVHPLSPPIFRFVPCKRDYDPESNNHIRNIEPYDGAAMNSIASALWCKWPDLRALLQKTLTFFLKGTYQSTRLDDRVHLDCEIQAWRPLSARKSEQNPTTDIPYSFPQRPWSLLSEAPISSSYVQNRDTLDSVTNIIDSMWLAVTWYKWDLNEAVLTIQGSPPSAVLAAVYGGRHRTVRALGRFELYMATV